MENEKVEKVVLKTGAVRDSKFGKSLPNQIHPYLRLRYGYRAAAGAEHYGKDNYLKGHPTEDSIESLSRHLAEYELGDRSEDHLSAIIFNVQQIMLNEMREGVPVDCFKRKLNNG